MEMKVTVKVEGLEPITEAIATLAAAIGSASISNAAAATAVIDKAKSGSKGKSPTAAVPSVDGDQTPLQTTVEPAPLPIQEPVVLPSVTSSEQADSAVVISDKDLRDVAGKAVNRNKELARDIINKYALTVSAVPQESRAALIKELEAVG